ncbi:serine hydrolase domain-containing protein [Fundidesulfovibrio agrisoli]|uniref:serine hydrolase domain-containing protein n=1 Tax=Fundidesulfovibrio agrisoli TaxID=2922717 RepID=UPI001FAC416B|nr:serine hydrolase domain-containing protein [Fundidesulfovibrio agrisoli]
MRRIVFTAALLAFAASLTLCPAARAARGTFTGVKELEAEIRKNMSRYDIKGLSIAVVDDQHVLWAQAYGWADEAKGVPAELDTIFRMGSISKVVSSAHVMQLAEAGLVDLDADIRAYVPEFSIRSRFGPDPHITPRMLMSHHSGLPTDVVAGMWSEHPQALAAYIPSLAQESMAAPPAKLWRYSNVGFSLLGRMVEKVEGMGFDQAMRWSLLEPLGMASSSYVMTPELSPRYSQGYSGGKEAPRPALRDMPAGSLYSTAPDMAAFIQAMLAGGGDVLSHRFFRQMVTPQFPGLPLDFEFQMGLGFMLSGLNLSDGSRLIWHAGTALPFQAFMAMEPNRKLGVVVMANTQEAAHFISDLAVKALELAAASRPGAGARPVPGSRVFRPEAFRPEKLTPEELATYAGDYAGEGGLLSTIRLVDGVLKASVEGRDVELTPARGGLLRLQAEKSLLPLLPKAGQEEYLEHMHPDGLDVLVLRGRARPVPLVKLQNKTIPAAWMARQGVYAASGECAGLCYKALALTVRDGQLMAVLGVSLPGGDAPAIPAVTPLVPLGDDQAVVAGLGIGSGATLRAEEDGLYYSGYHFKRMPEAEAKP